MRTPGIERVWITPGRGRGVRGRAGRDRRGRPSSSARAASTRAAAHPPAPGDPRRDPACALRPGSTSATSRPSRARRRLRPRRARRGARGTHQRLSSSTSSWPTIARCPAPRGGGVRRRPDRPAAPSTERGRLALATERDAAAAARSSTTSSTRPRPPSRPGPPRRGGHPPRARGRDPATSAGRSSAGPPDAAAAPSATSYRDPRRARRRSTRRGHATGPPRSTVSARPDRPRGVGRPARPPARAGWGDGPAPGGPFDWGRRPEHCRVAWLRGRFLARGSLSLAGGRTHLEFVVEPDEAPELAARLAEFGLPVSWRLRRGRGVVTSKNGEAVGTFLRRIGASGALLEVEARQVSRALRGELNRVLNAELANLQRAVSAAGRQLDAIDDARRRRAAAGQPYVVRLVAEARRETPEASLAELAERLEIHRSAVQRALERLERLADPRIAPSRRRRRPEAALWHHCSMRDVIVAANWKMHTTPADAGDLARDDRGADPRRGRDPGHLPAVRLPGRRARRLGRRRIPTSVSGHRTSITSCRAPTPARSRRRCWSASRLGHRRPLASGDATPARPTSSSAASSAGRSMPACGRSCASASSSTDARPASQDAVVDRQLAGALAGHDPATPRRRWAGHRLRAGLGDRHRAATRAGATRRRWPERSARRSGLGWVDAAEAVPILYGGSVTSANIAEFLAEPVDRRRARRRRVAQARRDGRDRGPGRADRRSPAARRRRVTPDPTRRARPRPIVLVVLDGFGIGRDPAADAIAAPGCRSGAACSRAGPTRRCAPRRTPSACRRARWATPRSGHLNLGAGRPVLQDLPRIDAAIADGSFFERPALLDACRRAARPDGRAAPHQPHRPGRRPRQRPPPRRPRRAGRARRASRPSASTRCSTAATRRRGRRSASSPTSRGALRRPIPTPGSRRSAGATTRWTAISAGTASSAATTPSSTGWGSARGAPIAAIEAGYARGENDEFVAADGHRRRRRPRPSRRRGHPRQLPGRPGAPADPRAGRRRDFDGFDRTAPDGRPAPPTSLS